jgi:ABC-type glutathione transport system ATPase component
LRRRIGFACLFVGHDLAVVARIADRLAVLRDGEVIEAGPAARVLGRPVRRTRGGSSRRPWCPTRWSGADAGRPS